MKYHLFQKFFGKVVKINQTSFLLSKCLVSTAHHCRSNTQKIFVFERETLDPVLEFNLIEWSDLICKTLSLILIFFLRFGLNKSKKICNQNFWRDPSLCVWIKLDVWRTLCRESDLICKILSFIKKDFREKFRFHIQRQACFEWLITHSCTTKRGVNL